MLWKFSFVESGSLKHCWLPAYVCGSTGVKRWQGPGAAIANAVTCAR